MINLILPIRAPLPGNGIQSGVCFIFQNRISGHHGLVRNRADYQNLTKVIFITFVKPYFRGFNQSL